MTSRCLSLLAIALCTSTAFAQTPPARPAPAKPAPPVAASAAGPRAPRAAAPTFDRARYAIPHKTFVLDNGLTLVVHKEESMVEIAKELRDVTGERPVAGEEFASIMRNQTLGLPGRFETLDALESAAVQLVNLGYPDDYFTQYATRVRALDEAALDTASRQYLRPKEVIWLVVGDLAKVEAGIRDLKFGEVIRLEAH